MYHLSERSLLSLGSGCYNRGSLLLNMLCLSCVVEGSCAQTGFLPRCGDLRSCSKTGCVRREVRRVMSRCFQRAPLPALGQSSTFMGPLTSKSLHLLYILRQYYTSKAVSLFGLRQRVSCARCDSSTDPAASIAHCKRTAKQPQAG
jgi:hypothetical protein